MSDASKPFFAVAASPDVAALIPDGRPALVFDRSGTRILWANAAGHDLIGARTTADLLGRSLPAAGATARRIAALAPLLGASPKTERVPLPVGIVPVQAVCRVSRVIVDATRTVLLVVADGTGASKRPDLAAARYQALVADFAASSEIEGKPEGASPAAAAAAIADGISAVVPSEAPATPVPPAEPAPDAAIGAGVEPMPADTAAEVPEPTRETDIDLDDGAAAETPAAPLETAPLDLTAAEEASEPAAVQMGAVTDATTEEAGSIADEVPAAGEEPVAAGTDAPEAASDGDGPSEDITVGDALETGAVSPDGDAATLDTDVEAVGEVAPDEDPASAAPVGEPTATAPSGDAIAIEPIAEAAPLAEPDPDAGDSHGVAAPSAEMPAEPVDQAAPVSELAADAVENTDPVEEPVPAAAADVAADIVPTEEAPAPTADIAATGFAFPSHGRTVRFLFELDPALAFTFASSDLAETVGPAATPVIGESWAAVAGRLGLDPLGRVAAALARKDTFTGLTVDWPIEGAALRIPVDLAGMPVFGRDRAFRGYRGFGMAKTGAAFTVAAPVALAAVAPLLAAPVVAVAAAAEAVDETAAERVPAEAFGVSEAPALVADGEPPVVTEPAADPVLSLEEVTESGLGTAWSTIDATDEPSPVSDDGADEMPSDAALIAVSPRATAPDGADDPDLFALTALDGAPAALIRDVAPNDELESLIALDGFPEALEAQAARLAAGEEADGPVAPAPSGPETEEAEEEAVSEAAPETMAAVAIVVDRQDDAAPEPAAAVVDVAVDDMAGLAVSTETEVDEVARVAPKGAEDAVPTEGTATVADETVDEGVPAEEAVAVDEVVTIDEVATIAEAASADGPPPDGEGPMGDEPPPAAEAADGDLVGETGDGDATASEDGPTVGEDGSSGAEAEDPAPADLLPRLTSDLAAGGDEADPDGPTIGMAEDSWDGEPQADSAEAAPDGPTPADEASGTGAPAIAAGPETVEADNGAQAAPADAAEGSAPSDDGIEASPAAGTAGPPPDEVTAVIPSEDGVPATANQAADEPVPVPAASDDELTAAGPANLLAAPAGLDDAGATTADGFDDAAPDAASAEPMAGEIVDTAPIEASDVLVDGSADASAAADGEESTAIAGEWPGRVDGPDSPESESSDLATKSAGAAAPETAATAVALEDEIELPPGAPDDPIAGDLPNDAESDRPGDLPSADPAALVTAAPHAADAAAPDDSMADAAEAPRSEEAAGETAETADPYPAASPATPTTEAAGATEAGRLDQDVMWLLPSGDVIPSPIVPRPTPPLSDAEAEARRNSLSRPEREAFQKIAEALGARLEAGTLVDSGSTDGGDAAEEAVAVPALPTVPPLDPSILDKLPVPVAILKDGEAVLVNRAFLDLAAYPDHAAMEVSGGFPAVFEGSPMPRPAAQPAIRRRDGVEIPVSVRLHSIPWGTGVASLLVLQETATATGRDRAVSAEARVEELEAILDTATDGVLVLDGSGVVVGVNRSAEALFGGERASMIGGAFVDLLAPESHRGALDYLDGLSRNGVASVLNDGREVIGRVRGGGLVPLFMTIGRVSSTMFCAVLRDITQWKRAEEELTAAKRSAEYANSQKSDFLAKVSHEIRTPLNAIIGFSEVMMEERFGPVGTQRYKEYLHDIHLSGSHIMSLVNDLLDLSKIEAGKLELSFEAVPVNEVIRECVALMQPQANRERIIIRTSLSSSLPSVVADNRSLRQIVLNLVSNAVKFNAPGGQVIVSTLYETTGEVSIRVRDTGPGMSEDDIRKALEPFRQLQTARPGRGTGLGLPLTKALVEANRASFRIDSTLGQGTLAQVTFPSTRVLAE